MNYVKWTLGIFCAEQIISLYKTRTQGINFSRTYLLDQDEDTSCYFLNAFVGNHDQLSKLLIDSQANGTAIKYDYNKSMTSKVNQTQMERIQLASENGCLIDGFEIYDQICFDQDEEICLDDQKFVYAEYINYPKLKDKNQMDGVIALNRYGYINDQQNLTQKLNIIQDFLLDDIILDSTVQLDLNFYWQPVDDSDSDQFEQIESRSYIAQSYITINGINSTNIQYQDQKNQGFAFQKNLMKDSKLAINILDASLQMSGNNSENQLSYSFFKQNGDKFIELRKCTAVLATACDKIRMPESDLEALAKKFQKLDKSIQFNSSAIFTSKQCQDLNLPNLIMTLNMDLQLEIPQIFYTKKFSDNENLESGCLLQFEINDEDNFKSDPIESPIDGKDYQSNSCYILGTPFLRAFMMVYNLEENKIGFAQKKQNHGAIMVGYDAPGWSPPKKIEQNDSQIIGQHENNSSDINIPEYEEPQFPQRPQYPEDQPQNNLQVTILNTLLYTLVFVLVIILGYVYIKQKKMNKQKATFVQSIKVETSSQNGFWNKKQKKQKSKQKKQKDAINESMETEYIEAIDQSMDQGSEFFSDDENEKKEDSSLKIDQINF